MDARQQNLTVKTLMGKNICSSEVVVFPQPLPGQIKYSEAG